MNFSQLKEEISKQKVGMEPHERLEKYLAGEEVDFLPYDLLGAKGF